MFGHNSWLMKHGCFIDTGDLSSGTGEVADSEDSDVGESTSVDLDEIDETEDTGDESGEAESDGPDADAVDQQTKNKQTPEADAAFAKLRREAEDAKKELSRLDTWVSEKFGQSHGLHTWEAYQKAIDTTHQAAQTNAQRQQMQAAQAEYANKFKQLEAQGYDPTFLSTLDQAFSQHPKLKQLEQINGQLQNALNGIIKTSAQEKQQQQAMTMVNDQFTELNGEYPEFKDIGALANSLGSETWEKLCGQLKKGYTMLDAYESVNRAALKKQTTAAVKQKTLNNLNSKAHLKTEGDGATEGGDYHIPADTMQMYLDQGMSKKSAMAFHKKLYG